MHFRGALCRDWGWGEDLYKLEESSAIGKKKGILDLCDSYRDLISLIWIGDSDLSNFILYNLYKKRYRSPRGQKGERHGSGILRVSCVSEGEAFPKVDFCI